MDDHFADPCQRRSRLVFDGFKSCNFCCFIGEKIVFIVRQEGPVKVQVNHGVGISEVFFNCLRILQFFGRSACSARSSLMPNKQ